MNNPIKKVITIRFLCLISLFFINSRFIYSLAGDETKKIVVLEDGTTIINTYNNIGKHIKEEIILRNGRHKTTFFDLDEQPKYGVLYTGSGAFGLMYYDQSMAPLFKFYDYGNDDIEIYFLSKDFEKIDTIKLYTENGKRKIDIKKDEAIDNKIKNNTIYTLRDIIIGIFIGIILSKILDKIRRQK